MRSLAVSPVMGKNQDDRRVEPMLGLRGRRLVIALAGGGNFFPVTDASSRTRSRFGRLLARIIPGRCPAPGRADDPGPGSIPPTARAARCKALTCRPLDLLAPSPTRGDAGRCKARASVTGGSRRRSSGCQLDQQICWCCRPPKLAALRTDRLGNRCSFDVSDQDWSVGARGFDDRGAAAGVLRGRSEVVTRSGDSGVGGWGRPRSRPARVGRVVGHRRSYLMSRSGVFK